MKCLACFCCFAAPENTLPWQPFLPTSLATTEQQDKTRCRTNSSRGNLARSLLEVGVREFRRTDDCVRSSASKQWKRGERKETVRTRSKLAMENVLRTPQRPTRSGSRFLSAHIQPLQHHRREAPLLLFTSRVNPHPRSVCVCGCELFCAVLPLQNRVEPSVHPC